MLDSEIMIRVSYNWTHTVHVVGENASIESILKDC